MSCYKNWYQVAILIVIILGFCATPCIANASNQKPFPPDQAVAGMSYGDWSAALWQYLLSIPNSNNPLFDDGTSENACSEGQSSGPVIFLSGSYAGDVKRKCTVPSVPIFFPIINAECSDVEDPPFFGSNAQERRICASKLIDGVDPNSLKVTINGKKVRKLEYFRAQSPDFQFTMPETDNILGLDGVTAGNAVADGYYVMLKPLKPGVHKIHFEGACVSGDCEGFTQDVTYILTVLP